MAIRIEKTAAGNDIVISGFEKGIYPSPHSGIANMQNVNISTEMGEVMASFGRKQSSMTDISSTGQLAYASSSSVFLAISGSNNFFKGMWIVVSDSSNTSELPNGTYYVLDVIGSNSFELSSSYNGSPVTGLTSGLTAVISLLRNLSLPVASATESYSSGGTALYRYYILDSQGLVWVYDTANDQSISDNLQYWTLPDNSINYFGSDTAPSGLMVLNGTLMVFSGNKIWVKPTVNLGSAYSQATNAILMSQATSKNPHFCLSGHQGTGYYTDGNYLGSIIPNVGNLVAVPVNVQSYASWSPTDSTDASLSIIAGSIPSAGPNVGEVGFTRIPAVFFPATGGTLPGALSANTIYYIEYSTANGTFQVFSALTGGSALTINDGSGQQYYNTFWMVGTHAGAYGDTSTVDFVPQAVGIPSFETAQCIAEIGNNIVIGCHGPVIYPWNQVDGTPSGIINLPEGDTKQIITVNQMAYIFAGSKGNIYITDGSTASLVIKVPDYCAGIAGTPSTYIEPKFVWGGAMYVRGRVYFSVLDQTLLPGSIIQDKAGNCGGIWSFTPTQNFYIGQDVGTSLHLENQNSYGTYNGYATVLIPLFDQSVAKAPQYWSAWQSSLVSPIYGIDKTDTNVSSTSIIQSDLIPVGTYLDRYTPKQIEYKIATPSAGTVAISYRKNATDEFVSCGNLITEGSSVSGYFNANFQGAQWVQLQATLTTPGTDFVRLTEMRIR